MPKAKIRIVLDTSILISALKTKDEKRSPAWFILNHLKSNLLQNYTSKDIIEEMKFTLAFISTELVSKKKNKQALAKADKIMRIILHHSKKITPKVDFSKDKTIKEKLKDDSDLKFLEVLYTAKAKYLITQNTKHFGNFVIEKNKKTGKAKLKQHYFYIMTARGFVQHLKQKHRT